MQSCTKRERAKGPVTHTGQNCDIMSSKNMEDRYVCVFLPVFMLCVLVLSTYTYEQSEDIFVKKEIFLLLTT